MKKINDYQELRKSTTTQGVPGRVIYVFDGYEFNLDVSLANANYIKLENCIFNGKVEFGGTYSEEVNLQSCEFNNDVSFDDSTFETKTRIQSVIFKNYVSFDNAKFLDLCDFWNTTFHKHVIFFKTDFYKNVVFSRNIFHENVLFTYTLIDKIAIFRGAHFKKGLDISTTLINGSLYLFDFKLHEFDAKIGINTEQEYESMISEEGIIPEKNKRETYRIIKKQFESQNNHIHVLEYKALELQSYQRELLRKRWDIFNQNFIILWLNSISNRNGISWFRGMCFTFIIAIVFFYFAILSTSNYEIALDFHTENSSNIGKLFFEFLTPTHKIDFLDKEGSTLWTYFFDFWGRIFIAYGIYQTIQAFRKFRT